MPPDFSCFRDVERRTGKIRASEVQPPSETTRAAHNSGQALAQFGRKRSRPCDAAMLNSWRECRTDILKRDAK